MLERQRDCRKASTALRRSLRDCVCVASGKEYVCWLHRDAAFVCFTCSQGSVSARACVSFCLKLSYSTGCLLHMGHAQVNWTLHYIADLDIPQKRGTFIEFRNGASYLEAHRFLFTAFPSRPQSITELLALCPPFSVDGFCV